MKPNWMVLALLGAASTALAQTTPHDALSTRSGWEAGIQASRYRYEEPNFMKLTGNRAGFTAAYSRIEGRTFGRIESRYSYGSLKYEGSGTQNGVPDTILEVRALAGADYRVADSVSVSPFAGLGYRYLYDDLRGYDTVDGVTYVGYRRYSQYLYAPIGATLRLQATRGWVVAPTIEYDVFIRGRQQSLLTDTGIRGSRDVTQTQKRGRGYRASLMMEVNALVFGPWMHYWSIEDSEVVRGFFEPANRTREFGFEVRYRF